MVLRTTASSPPSTHSASTAAAIHSGTAVGLLITAAATASTFAWRRTRAAALSSGVWSGLGLAWRRLGFGARATSSARCCGGMARRRPASELAASVRTSSCASPRLRSSTATARSRSPGSTTAVCPASRTTASAAARTRQLALCASTSSAASITLATAAGWSSEVPASSKAILPTCANSRSASSCTASISGRAARSSAAPDVAWPRRLLWMKK
mmetsp:Transcript_5535/g.11196  ORF Transcript_5535/g.11196 Transcript_5535/m.11196 type:complete len:213 (-) Transcript_5535:186-824(-)